MSLRVLFVDDEPPMLRSLSRDFSIDYDLSVAYSAKEAMELLAGPGCFDVVISDVTMPGMNGLDFIERVASEYPRTRFIVLSGNADKETLDRIDSMDSVSAFLRKPCSREAILAAIEEAAVLVK